MKHHLLHTVLIFAILFVFSLGCGSTNTDSNSLGNNSTGDNSSDDTTDDTTDNTTTDGTTTEPSTEDPLPEPLSTEPDPLPESVPCEPGVFCIVTTDLADATLSSPYSQELTVQGGTGVGYTWSISSGSLPEGVLLDGNNETISWGSAVLSGNVTNDGGNGLVATDLTEISGLAVSRLNSKVLWVLDDSGNGPDIFAIDEEGSVLQKYTISGVSNRDWEDLAIGKGPDSNKEYLYIGDFGDNSASRGVYQIIRVEEPSVPSERVDAVSLAGSVFYFRYPDGSKNCEAMIMDWEGEIIYLVEKTGGVGRVYKFPSEMDSSWDAAHPVTLLAVSNGGIVSGLITGGSSSRDNERILLRQYDKIWEYAKPYGSNFEDIFDETPTEVGVGSAKNQQYETIAYSDDGTNFYTITEKGGGSTIPVYKFEANHGNNNTEISGLPSSAGTYIFVVSVKDSAGNITSREFSMEIE